MNVGLFFTLAIGALLLFFVFERLRQYLRQKRHERLRARPLSDNYLGILQSNVPLYSCLPEGLQADLCANINVFLDEKEFHGRGGLDITDEMRLTVAGNACMLLLNRPNIGFPGFKTILIYPQTYTASQQERNGAVVVQSSSHRAGESWHRGPVILAWNDVIFGSRGRGDGFNVVIHEFAHKLDEINSVIDGVPVLDNKVAYMEWARVFSKDYQAFVEKVQYGSDVAIDDYGATSPEEFFAVCTESFFEKPHALKKHWPDLYQQLAGFYKVDPASWRTKDHGEKS